MKRLLVVVDYQNDLVDGALGFPEAAKLARPIAEKIASYREAGGEVAFIFDTHQSDYLPTKEGQTFPAEHCIDGKPGHNLYGEVAFSKRDVDMVFHKWTIGSAEFYERCRQSQRAADEVGKPPFESIEFVGLVSNVCVLANAVLAKTACPDVPIIVDASCVASPDPDMNEKALDIIEELQIDVINR